MAISITVAITLDEGQQYTPLEAAVVKALGGDAQPQATVVNHFVGTPTEPAVEKPAPKARAPRQSTRAAVLEDTPEPVAAAAPVADEPEAAEPATPAAAEEPAEPAAATEEPTLDDAVSKATTFIGEGKAAAVKAALTKVGAKRVGELKGAALGQFISELEAA